MDKEWIHILVKLDCKNIVEKMPFGCARYSRKCPRHELVDIIDMAKVLNYSADCYKKTKFYHVKCGPSTCQAKILNICGKWLVFLIYSALHGLKKPFV